jgi:hypothetical protein
MLRPDHQVRRRRRQAWPSPVVAVPLPAAVQQGHPLRLTRWLRRPVWMMLPAVPVAQGAPASRPVRHTVDVGGGWSHSTKAYLI